ncbi:PaaI family thioesterase [Paenalcaligenes niemegkensis]|uniref:PaaI family thioesterase n=1 Tax=Paenalcaligenes niemegkensis TaxID=2895469 RepID=UPI001EE884B8|nr:PaaI family thioesterase [Paenalcaligenes niemegkensis]MCQ9615692.1 PaaI family thioesterase [Paenalcaligenes niemegkensis]
MTTAELQQCLTTLFAPWIRELKLEVSHADNDSVTLTLPFSEHLTHVAGVVCGQVYMAAADTAMVLALSNVLGEFKPMTTISLNTNFIRPVSAGDVRVVATVLRRGRSIAFGEIFLYDSDDNIVAHASTTYALL